MTDNFWTLQGNQLKKWRDRRNLTQKQLAMKIGCQRMTISRIEQEKQKPSLELAYSLANALDLKIEDLFLFENKERENV